MLILIHKEANIQTYRNYIALWKNSVKGVLNPNFRPFSFELKKKIFFK